MAKSMLIDSAHAEEIRVAVVDGDKLDKFDFETPSKTQVKGNIYLAKIVRVEPSLQAAFVDYGGDRHGFLSFSEIHHDYFQIPVGDRQDLENHIQNAVSALLAEAGESAQELDPKEISKLRYQFYRRYKIQEVIKKRQIMLVQVTKEERGNKGAALTTYISLAGRYCVLMPNTAKGSGVSRKVVNHEDREKLKKIIADFKMENGSVLIRTAGIGHPKTEIIKDFNYLKKMWDEIRETTVKSTAPYLIHEEAGIIKRAIRDLYSRDIDSIFVEGEEGYKTAKSFVKKIMPSHVKKVKQYSDEKLPLFAKFKISEQINQIYSTRVDLPSGGYLVINTTEAMISIDVNSGKATRERNIAETALKTNLEAVAEIARQCRLRDLAGLIVVDLIDMTEKRNNSQVERCLRDALREDKAKIQVGTISNFGLLEFSRQRLRSSIVDANMITCPHCNGIGSVWSNESVAIQVLRKIEETVAVLRGSEITVTLSLDVATYLMNHKRQFISNMEGRFALKIIFKIDVSASVSDFKIEQTMKPLSVEESEESPVNVAEENKDRKKVEKAEEKAEEESNVIPLPAKAEKNKRKRKRRRSVENSTEDAAADAETGNDVGVAEVAEIESDQKNIAEFPIDSAILPDPPPEDKEEKTVYDLLLRDMDTHESLLANAMKITEVLETPDAAFSEQRVIGATRPKRRKAMWWQKLVKKPK